MNCSKFFVSAGYAVLCGFMLALPAGATTRYVATNGSDSNACTTSSRCLTFDRAYQLSAAGDIVLVAAGSYSAQTVSRNPAITGPFSLTPHATDVTIKPESGPGTVTVNDIDINDGTSTLTTANFVQHITFEDMTFTKGGDVHGGACIHFVRTTHRFTTFMNRASFVSYQNADIGGQSTARTGWTSTNSITSHTIPTTFCLKAISSTTFIVAMRVAIPMRLQPGAWIPSPCGETSSGTTIASTTVAMGAIRAPFSLKTTCLARSAISAAAILFKFMARAPWFDSTPLATYRMPGLEKLPISGGQEISSWTDRMSQ